MEIILGERLPLFGEDRSLVSHHIHIFGKLKIMLGHRRSQLSIVSGGKVDGAKREGHKIVPNCDGRRRLIFERRDLMVIVTTRCKSRRSDAQSEKAQQKMEHKSSKK